MDKLVSKLQAASQMLPKQQRLLCEYISENPIEASALTIAELANITNVGTATVMRMIHSLGYNSYQAFKADLTQVAVEQGKTSYSSYWNLRRYYGSGAASASEHHNTAALLQSCEALSKQLNNPSTIEQITSAADAIIHANYIYLLGQRFFTGAAITMESLLINHPIKVRQLSTQTDYLYDRLTQLTPKDLLFTFVGQPLISQTATAIQYCYDHRIPVIVITNAEIPDVHKNATIYINTNSINSPVAAVPTIIILEAIAMEIAQRTAEMTQLQIQKVERLLDDINVRLWEPSSDSNFDRV